MNFTSGRYGPCHAIRPSTAPAAAAGASPPASLRQSSRVSTSTVSKRWPRHRHHRRYNNNRRLPLHSELDNRQTYHQGWFHIQNGFHIPPLSSNLDWSILELCFNFTIESWSKPENRVVQPSFPISSHCKFWSSRRVADSIRSETVVN